MALTISSSYRDYKVLASSLKIDLEMRLVEGSRW